VLAYPVSAVSRIESPHLTELVGLVRSGKLKVAKDL